jgi:hypothetical protein
MAAPSIHQSNVTDGSTATVTAMYTSAQTAGNTNIVCIGWADVTTTIDGVPTDTEGNVYSLVTSYAYNDGATSLSVSVYACAGIRAAPPNTNVVSVSWQGGTGIAQFPEVYILEIQGADRSLPIDHATVDIVPGASGTTASAGPVTTGAANELLIGYMYTWADSTSPGSGWTADSNSPTPNGITLEYQTVAVSGSSVTATTGLGSNSSWLQVVFGLKPPSSEGPVVLPTDVLFVGMT